MKKIRLFSINTGKTGGTYVLDFDRVGSMAMKAGLGKILTSSSRLKLLVNGSEVGHVLRKFYSIEIVNVLDLEVFGLTVDVEDRNNIPEYYRFKNEYCILTFNFSL